jgi:predicted dehydrogenase
VRVAVVGLGYWGPNHVRNLAAIDACTSIVAVDLDEKRAQDVARAHVGTEPATDLDEVLADDELAAVVLATPVESHVALARRVIEAGKSVLVEKPFATSRRAAEELVELARDRGVLATAGHTFLYSPPVLTIADLLRAGEIGDPLYLHSSRVNLGIHSADVSVLWDLAPHDLSILLHWVDERPRTVSATGRASVPGHPPDVAFVDVAFESGFVANLHLSWLAPTKVRRMTLVGSRRMVVYEDTHPDEPVKVYDKGVDIPDPEDFGQYKLIYRTGDIVSPRVPVWEPLRQELSDFLSRVAAGETPDAREQRVIDIVAAVEAAEESMNDNGRPVVL